jgi:hypothetical protein
VSKICLRKNCPNLSEICLTFKTEKSELSGEEEEEEEEELNEEDWYSLDHLRHTW